MEISFIHNRHKLHFKKNGKIIDVVPAWEFIG